jgi:RNA 2',3'-cyclic 3'-phosphodiesterase
MRFTIAIQVSEEIREHLSAFQEPLIQDYPAVSWLKPENFVVTTKFLGNPRHARIGQMKKTLTRSASLVAPFSFSLERLGCFPAEGPARVIWVGITDASGMLTRFQKDCNREFAALGIPPPEHEFKPHIIVGRAEEKPLKEMLRKAIEHKRLEPLSQQVEECCLVQSKLSKAGPDYRIVAHARFTATIVS